MQVEGSALYKAPDFDSPVIEYLPAGTKLIISKKSVQGRGGLGLFYKAKAPSKKIGYLVDVEVIPQFKTSKYNKKKKIDNPVFDQAVDFKENPDRKAVYFTRYLGVGIQSLAFTEKIAGKNYQDQVMLYGFRLFGPGTIIDGPPLDFNIYFTPKVPKYYNKLASSEPTGFLMFGDLLLMLPFYEGPNSLFSYGLGMMWTYTNFKIRTDLLEFDNQEVRIGAVLAAGYSQRFGDWALRVDGKYNYEKSGYMGFGLTLFRHY